MWQFFIKVLDSLQHASFMTRLKVYWVCAKNCMQWIPAAVRLYIVYVLACYSRLTFELIAICKYNIEEGNDSSKVAWTYCPSTYTNIYKCSGSAKLQFQIILPSGAVGFEMASMIHCTVICAFLLSFGEFFSKFLSYFFLTRFLFFVKFQIGCKKSLKK